MPHRLKRPQQQLSRRLPHVEEASPEDEEGVDEQRHRLLEKRSPKYHTKQLARDEDEDGAGGYADDDPEEGSSMVANSARERSPLLLRRALIASVVGRRGGPSTPVPGWKLSDNPFYDAMAAVQQQQTPPIAARATSVRSRRISVSARKLAATLWELHGTPLYETSSRGKSEKHQLPQSHQERQQAHPQPSAHDFKRNFSQLPSAMAPTSNLTGQRSSRHPVVEYKNAYSSKRQGINSSGQQATSAYSQVLKLIERSPDATSAQLTAQTTNEENGSETRPAFPTVAVKSERGAHPSTSSDLVKVLNQIWALEEQYNSSMGSMATLQADLEKAQIRVQELTMEQKAHRSDIERLTKKLAEQKTMSCEREQEAVKAAIKPLQEELEEEKKSRRKLDLQHKKVAKELTEVKKAMAKTVQELEREQKARELMEDVCDELAREIGEDKAQVEELKRESAKVREEVEEERKMLQMAEVWREERVQMKLAEARLELEEKNVALDRLRSELEAFLKAKRSLEEESRQKGAKVSSNVHLGEEATPSHVDKSHIIPERAADDEAHGGSQSHQESDYVGSVEDEFHSFELNKESLIGKVENKQGEHSNFTHHEVRPAQRGTGTTVRMSKFGQQGSRTELERTLNNPTQSSKKGATTDSHWIERTIEKGELRDWKGERVPSLDPKEWARSSWQSESEESHGLLTAGTSRKTGRRQLQGHSSSFSRSSASNTAASASDVFGNSAASKLPIFEPSADSKLFRAPILHQQSFDSHSTSPTRQWGQYWSSPDPTIPGRIARGSSKEMPRAARDNSLKAKLLEAKLEGQQKG